MIKTATHQDLEEFLKEAITDLLNCSEGTWNVVQDMLITIHR